MAIISNLPISLPVSKIIATMTSLIGIVRYNETLAPSDIVNDLVDSCMVDGVDYGKGIVYVYKNSLLDVEDLSETSSAFTIAKPDIKEEVITIDQYKFIEISLSDVLSRDIGVTGYQIEEFMAFAMSLLQDTKQFDMFDVANGLYQNWTPGQSTQTVQIDQINTASLTGADLRAAMEINATNIAKVMRKTLNNMKVKNTKFTDITGQISALRSDDLKLVVNDTYWTNFLADSLASLYHSERVGDMIPGANFVLLPTDSMKSGNESVIGWLSDRKKFAIAQYYNITLSILDPSTTYTNTFFHYAYGAGVFTHAPGVKFVANPVTPSAG